MIHTNENRQKAPPRARLSYTEAGIAYSVKRQTSNSAVKRAITGSKRPGMETPGQTV